MSLGGSGYNRKSPTSPSSLTGIFASSAAKPETSNVNMSQVATQGPISMLAGTPGPEIPTTHQADIASGHNAAGNLQASQNVDGKLGQVNEAKTQFANITADIQGSLNAALEQGATDLGFDVQTAKNTFMPPPPSNDATTVALNSGAPGVTVVADALNVLPKLSPKQEAALASKIYTLLTPTRDVQRQEIKEPSIPNKIAPQLEKLGSEIVDADFLKQALRPVEEQPEFKALSDTEEKLKQAQADHAKQNPVDALVVSVAQKTGVDVCAIDAQKVDPEELADTCRFVGDTLAGTQIAGQLNIPASLLSAANDEELRERIRREAEAKNAIAPPRAALAMGMFGSPMGNGGAMLGAAA